MVESDFHHEPVLLEQAISYLVTDPAGIYVDGTVGGGGHSQGILNVLNKQGRLIGLDRDPEAIAVCSERFIEEKDRVSLIQGAFGNMQSLLFSYAYRSIHGILLDLGVSSHQIDTPGRGFSYMNEGPLDMRMESDTGMSARDVVMTYSENALANVFFHYGEERHSRRIARKIFEFRMKGPINTTEDLATIVRSCVPHQHALKTLSRISQAIRIEVNDELKQLQLALSASVNLLKKGGRCVVISYHSLEDRIVKRFFRGEAPTFDKSEPEILVGKNPFKVLTKRVVTPGPEEIRMNSRARSAKLRAAEKVA